MEETCTWPAPDGIYEATHYGSSLPFKKESLVDTGCISCKEPKEYEYQNYYDQQDADEVTDVCENLYEEAAKCEKDLGGYHYYRDNSGCAFIEGLKVGNGKNMATPAKVFAGIFAVTTALLAAASVFYYKSKSKYFDISSTLHCRTWNLELTKLFSLLPKENKRQNVKLSSDAMLS